jgi:NAD+ synthase (glutamine-hydrolysing)
MPPALDGAVLERLATTVGAPTTYHISGTESETAREPVAPTVHEAMDPLTEVYTAIVIGTRDYVRKSGFSGAVIGLSGGIDSALTTAIAVDALGADRMTTFFMPSQYTADQSGEDSRALVANLGVRMEVLEIKSGLEWYVGELGPLFEGRKPDVTEENLQARIRGTLLMAASNKFGWLVLTTGNKSEMATGYATLYGDMAGGFAVIKDVPKTLVQELSRHRNVMAGREVIPESIIVRPPTAELRPDQKDEDSLPPYAVLDPILKAYVEDDWTVEEMLAAGMPADAVAQTIRLVDHSEYKRRQAPPGVKITRRNFGRDRRLPIVNRYSPR